MNYLEKFVLPADYEDPTGQWEAAISNYERASGNTLLKLELTKYLPSTFINREVLMRHPVISFDISEAAKGKRMYSRSLSKYLSDLPKISSSLASYAQTTFSDNVREIFDHYLTNIILGSPSFRRKYADLFKASRMDFANHKMTYAKNEAEMSTAMVCCGAPKMGVAYPFFPFAHLPEEQKELDKLLSDPDLIDNVAKTVAPNGASRTQSLALPRTTSPGTLLYARRASSKFKLFSKVVQALFGFKCPSLSRLKDFYSKVDALSMRYEGLPLSNLYLGGERIMHMADKKDALVQAFNSTSIFDGAIVANTKGIFPRNRGVYPSQELDKGYLKPLYDGVKHAFFTESPIGKVDPSYHYKTLLEIEKNGLNYTTSGDIYNAYDLSNCDMTMSQAWGRFFFRVLHAIVPDSVNREDVFLRENAKVLTCASWGRSVPYLLRSYGCGTLSGDPGVSLGNNINHCGAAFISIKEASGSTYNDIRKRLFDRTDLFLIHSDDNANKMKGWGSNEYEIYYRTFEKLGFKIGWETCLSFLKKHVYWQNSSGLCGGFPGSHIKNRIGEYPVSHPVVVAAGLMSVREQTPKGLFPSYDEFLDLIASVTPYGSMQTIMSSKEQIQLDLLDYSKSSDAAAKQVTDALRGLFFSGGEEYGDGLPVEIFGSIQYDPNVEGEHFGLKDKSLEQLEKIILSLLEELLRRDHEEPDWAFVSNLVSSV